jgi:hypothetical protein
MQLKVQGSNEKSSRECTPINANENPGVLRVHERLSAAIKRFSCHPPTHRSDKLSTFGAHVKKNDWPQMNADERGLGTGLTVSVQCLAGLAEKQRSDDLSRFTLAPDSCLFAFIRGYLFPHPEKAMAGGATCFSN